MPRLRLQRRQPRPQLHQQQLHLRQPRQRQRRRLRRRQRRLHLHPLPPRRRRGLPAWSALVGNSISGMEDGKPLVEHYLADGTAKSMSGNEISTGKWALVGDTVCFKYDNDTECYKIEVIGNTATFTDAKGSGTRYDILKGNPKNL
jgi:hypothetical protein